MQDEIEALKKEWIILSTLSKEVLEQSDYSDEVKHGCEWSSFLDRTNIDETGQSKRSNASYIRHCIKGKFAFWEIRIDIWTEIFWQKVRDLGLQHKRIEPLKKALERGRFANIGESMHTRYEWERLLKAGIIQKRYTSKELDTIAGFIDQDASKRLCLLKKCLRLKRIASSDYLKYGEAIAYFTRGKLFKHIQGTLLQQQFTNDEINTLNTIWK